MCWSRLIEVEEGSKKDRTSREVEVVLKQIIGSERTVKTD